MGQSDQRSRNHHRMSCSKMQLNHLGVVQAARAIERNEIRCVDLAQACLDRIAERNNEVEAFVAFDADKALAIARQMDANPSGHVLRGIPFAVKDVIETSDYHTQYRSEHTSELQSLMRTSYAVFCLKKKKITSKAHQQQQKYK